MHCFNKYENQKICPDFEVSYLIECKQPLEQNPIRNQRRHQQNKLSCAINNTNATVPTILISTSPTMLSSTSLTSNGRATSIKFMYLMIIFVGLLIWNYICEINTLGDLKLGLEGVCQGYLHVLNVCISYYYCSMILKLDDLALSHQPLYSIFTTKPLGLFVSFNLFFINRKTLNSRRMPDRQSLIVWNSYFEIQDRFFQI